MIQKTTKIICDNCGKGIYDWPKNMSYREVAYACKKKNIAVVRYLPGRRNPYIFCNEKCLKEYADKNGYEV